MVNLSEYIKENTINIDESIIKNILSLAFIRNIDSQELLNGILSMYEYICDEDDIKLFYDDFPLKQRIFWKTLYEMYKKSVWSIFDSSDNEEEISKLGLQTNVMTKISVEMRRELRKIIKDSRNDKLDIKPSEVDMVLPIFDTQNSKTYYITLNRTTGFKKLFRMADIKFLEKAFEKLGSDVKNEKIDFKI